MKHKKELEDLNKKTLKKIDEFVKTKKKFNKEHHEKLNAAKSNWQSSWAGLMDVILYLESLEI